MKKRTTSERLKQLMQERNLKQVDILNKAQPYCKKYGIKLTKQDLCQYVSGKVEPAQNKLAILSMTLKVNESWLVGFDVPKEKQADELVELINSLDADQQKNVLNYINFLKFQQSL